ncbi:MAG: MotA/TolQ/ExbB proton channel family protein [bacterium]|nr:MotA/TolQ/ExbB proton channel family protein [bacterium]
MALTFAAALTPVPFLGALTAGDIIALINTSTFFGKFILFVLLVMSVLSWAVFLDKARTYAKLRRGHLAFWDHCERWLAGEVNRRDLDAWCKANSELPLCSLMVEAGGARDQAAVRRASERVIYLEIEHLERYVILLSTTVTVAPFLGLLGTVWGIMASFWSMASMHSANLTVVAPGIAEALITTVAGLGAAIPAVIFYNMLVRKIDLVANELDRLRTILEEAASGDDATSREAARRPERHERETI